MSTTKLISGRPELSLKEAAELFGCTVDDLIYKAAEGELTLYVVAQHIAEKDEKMEGDLELKMAA